MTQPGERNSVFCVSLVRGNLTRTVRVEAPHGAAARALAARECERGELVPARESACLLVSQAAVDPSPRMGPGHARHVAEGRP